MQEYPFMLQCSKRGIYMTDFTANNTWIGRQSLASFGATIRRVSGLFSGLTAGYRTYEAYTKLDNMSDAQLAARGLTRRDLPRAAAAEAGLFDQD